MNTKDSASPPLNRLFRGISGGSVISGVDRAALPWLVAELHDPTSGTLVFVANSEEEAETVAADLRLFSGAPPLLLPAWEFSPYRKIAPSITARHRRLHALGTLLRSDPAGDGVPGAICVTSRLALSQCAPSQDLFSSSPVLRAGSRISPHGLSLRLLALGYQPVSEVMDIGTFSRRGGILDLFVPGSPAPVRVDYFDDEIESLRSFDPETQTSHKNSSLTQVIAWPNRDFFCDPESLASARLRVRDWCDSASLPRKSRERILAALGEGIVSEDMDYLLPLLSTGSVPAVRLLGENTRLLTWEPESGQKHQEDALSELASQFERQNDSSHEKELILPPQELFLSADLLNKELRRRGAIVARALRITADTSQNNLHVDTSPTPALHTMENSSGRHRSVSLDHLVGYLKDCRESGTRVTILCRSEAQRERVTFLLNQRRVRFLEATFADDSAGDPLSVRVCMGELSHGFRTGVPSQVYLPDHEIFGTSAAPPGRPPATRSRASREPEQISTDLQEGDLVVHPEHGVGRFSGIVTLTTSGVTGEFVLLEYAGNDKLYLPVYRLNLIQRWIGAGGTRPALDRLGSQQFQKAKDRAREAAHDIAADLVRTQAERRMKKGFRFGDPDELFREFEANFPFEETPDQLRAIEDTIGDMCSDRPMDRLICGDVGFGKTEVAIRAAFKACQDGKQVAVLAPTTVLAEQHLATFSRRLKDHAVTVRSLSRFRPRAEQKETIAGLADGKVDIVIGTHRLLSKDVRFTDLGLIVIDEEQRFGVEHKERLKRLRATVDVLTLSATPIPRTLHMSLMGLRDISVIRTPPAERTSIKTHLAHFDPDVIREAIRMEVSRGGQVFFIHNRVETIDQMKTFLEEAVPGVSIGVGHGQMPERELERVMAAFYSGDIKVLLASAIVENGLDVSNANTIIVNRADTFGLAQLYQIRGRVGRSSARAHAWLLVPETGRVTDDARQRLQILQRFTELGSGYTIANYDLELRGGGDLLGDSQSGHIAAIGYDLYLEILGEEIRKMRGEAARELCEETEIQSVFPALLPPDYVQDMRSRLHLYRKLSSLETEEGLDSAAAHLVDRFGPLPDAASDFIWLLKIRIWGRRAGIRMITVTKYSVALTAATRSRVDPHRVLAFLTKDPLGHSLSPSGTLTVKREIRSLRDAFDAVKSIAMEIVELA